ncbi:hypothetical protein NK983_30840, partial [Salmonella enterica subsp. enterica serovar Typhimurium]|nr:hypothetical protein [Salmonella enterica subsp. enterica serovar Typhimurium]
MSDSKNRALWLKMMRLSYTDVALIRRALPCLSILFNQINGLGMTTDESPHLATASGGLREFDRR